MKTNINTYIHFAVLDKDDNVADCFVGLRRYPSTKFILFITSDLFHDLKRSVDNALESLKILIPDLKVEIHNTKLKDYWEIFFKTQEICEKIANNSKNVHFYANISTKNRIAALAIRDALAAVGRSAVCYYRIRGKSEEERTEILEVPVIPFAREISRSIPILRSLYERGGKASSIEDIAKDIGEKLSRSKSFGSRAKLVEYYIRKLEIYAVVRTIPGKKRGVILTGTLPSIAQAMSRAW